MARLVSIVYTPRDVERRPTDHFARVKLERTTLVEGHGIAGDLKGTPKRQLNVMRAETLEDLAAEGLRTEPGEMGEQIVIAGLDRELLVAPTRLRIGPAAIIEIATARTGCDRFEYIQGVTRARVAGRMGVMAQVIAGGEIAVGDAVTLES
jgi:MOSC domain-containing protein YiiM